MRNGDLADVMVLAGQPAGGYSGALSMDASVAGTIGNPTGTADLQVVNGTLKAEPFDRLQAPRQHVRSVDFDSIGIA